MPELPEVENLRRYLIAQAVPGRTIVDLQLDWPGVGNTLDGMGGLSGLPGRRIGDVRRHGKQLLVALDRGVLGLHMGMTGRLAVMAPDDAPLRYARTTLFLDDERRIELDDPRRWAMVRLEDSAGAFTGGLGPDALDPALDAQAFMDRVAGKRSPIKSVLMDQSVLAGVGNIYADEALHVTGISPVRRASRIARTRLERLHGAIVTVLERSIAFIESHPDEDGRPFVVDAYDDRMRLRRKKGSACPDCAAALSVRKFGGRTAYFCPHCQR